jgi:hypothetical protein
MYEYLNFKVSFTAFSLVYHSAFAPIFPRSQPMRESNTSTTLLVIPLQEGNGKKIIV